MRTPDLRPVFDEERWQRATAEEGDPLLPLITHARARSRQLTDRAVDRIRTTIPAYGEDAAVSRDDLWLSVQRNLEINLLILAERRELTGEEIDARANLGIRRADAGVAVSDLLRAFRVGYLVLWEGLTEVARELGADAVDQLLDDAGRIWDCLDRISSAVADRYRDRLAQRDVDVRRRALALLAGLERHPDGKRETEAAARELGLDPTGAFAAAVCKGHVTGLQGPGTSVAEQPDRTVVLTQVRPGTRLVAGRLRARLTEGGATAIGIGMVGHGLGGARRSLREAEAAHRLAVETAIPAAEWGDDWFACLAVAAAPSLEPLVADAVAELERSCETVETLTALVAHNGNTAAAARDLHVHPNTVAYRLQRLKETTGLDVKCDRGLLMARLALTLAARS